MLRYTFRLYFSSVTTLAKTSTVCCNKTTTSIPHISTCPTRLRKYQKEIICVAYVDSEETTLPTFLCTSFYPIYWRKQVRVRGVHVRFEESECLSGPSISRAFSGMENVSFYWFSPSFPIYGLISFFYIFWFFLYHSLIPLPLHVTPLNCLVSTLHTSLV